MRTQNLPSGPAFHVHLYILALACTLLLQGCNKESHLALGTIERERVILKSTAAEIIIARPAKEGTQVKKGDILLQLDDRRQQAQVAKAQAKLLHAKAAWNKSLNGARIEDIDAAKAKTEGAQATLVEANKNYRRALELQQKQLSTQALLDSARAKKGAAEAALKSAQKQLLLLTNGTRREDLDQAEADFNEAAAEVELALFSLSELTITATRDGYLDSLPWHEGERVTTGTPIAVLLAGEHPHARIYIPEPLRIALTINTRVPVFVDGIDHALQGRIRWISSDPAFTPYYALNETDRARLMYLAEVDILDNYNLPIGLPAEVDLSGALPQ